MKKNLTPWILKIVWSGFLICGGWIRNPSPKRFGPHFRHHTNGSTVGCPPSEVVIFVFLVKPNMEVVVWTNEPDKVSVVGIAPVTEAPPMLVG